MHPLDGDRCAGQAFLIGPSGLRLKPPAPGSAPGPKKPPQDPGPDRPETGPRGRAKIPTHPWLGGFSTVAISFHDISVATYLQTLGAVSGFLAEGEKHFRAKGVPLDDVVAARLHEDMLPFSFQIVSVAHHSLGAIKAIRAGLFQPPGAQPARDYAGLQKLVAETRDELAGLARAEVDSLENRDVVFSIGDFKLPFVARDFVLSFSHPNFYFHATTAYDILRMKGVPIGKRNFMGAMRLKT